MKKRKVLFVMMIIGVMILLMTACGADAGKTSGDADYEAQTIVIEGLPGGNKETSIAELRKLEQHDLAASYKRTTGMYEEFKMQGPYLQDVIAAVGGNLQDYAGIGVMGKDAYYCLVSQEVIEATPDLMLSLIIDGQAKLEDGEAPARLAVQGQFGPYWVKMVDKIILYKEIPEKVIKSVWIFNNLAAGIEPYQYEYYGSKDNAIDMEQIFSRLDYVDSKAFFTMKSSDGFKKNEALNMVKARYYIKTEGVDAPTNISPYIKLGMNVKNIAWISTNADAAIFPQELLKYMDTQEINGQKGLPLNEILYETEVKEINGHSFDVLGTNGEKVTVKGEDLAKGILVAQDNGSAAVVWDQQLGYPNIPNLLRIRLVDKAVTTESNTTNAEVTPGDTVSADAVTDKKKLN